MNKTENEIWTKRKMKYKQNEKWNMNKTENEIWTKRPRRRSDVIYIYECMKWALHTYIQIYIHTYTHKYIQTGIIIINKIYKRLLVPQEHLCKGIADIIIRALIRAVQQLGWVHGWWYPRCVSPRRSCGTSNLLYILLIIIMPVCMYLGVYVCMYIYMYVCNAHFMHSYIVAKEAVTS